MAKPPKKTDLGKKPRTTPPLVNHCHLMPTGANRWYRLYDPALCEFIPGLYENGESDAEVAYAIGIAKSTLYEWISKYPEFKAAVDCGKTAAERIFQVAGREAALGQRDINYPCWAANMRNRYDYDPKKTESVPGLPDSHENEIRKVAEEKLESKLSDY